LTSTAQHVGPVIRCFTLCRNITRIGLLVMVRAREVRVTHLAEASAAKIAPTREWRWMPRLGGAREPRRAGGSSAGGPRCECRPCASRSAPNRLIINMFQQEDRDWNCHHVIAAEDRIVVETRACLRDKFTSVVANAVADIVLDIEYANGSCDFAKR
jgi:hypothetical protein